MKQKKPSLFEFLETGEIVILTLIVAVVCYVFFSIIGLIW